MELTIARASTATKTDKKAVITAKQANNSPLGLQKKIKKYTSHMSRRASMFSTNLINCSSINITRKKSNNLSATKELNRNYRCNRIRNAIQKTHIPNHKIMIESIYWQIDTRKMQKRVFI